jgi:adenylate kinase family enzyme
MRRVLVIGSGGSGKSTFSTRLGELLNLEVHHLDKLFWHAGWVETPRDEWLKIVTKLIERDSWIVDGNFSGTLEVRIQKCDTVIFLDVSRWLCLWRIIMRALRFRDGTRPDMAEGCRERLNAEFIAWVWNYPRRSKPKVVKLLAEHSEGKKIVWLRTRAEVKEFLMSLQR